MAVSGSIKLEVKLNDRITTSTTGDDKHTVSETYTWTLADGTGADQINKFWSADFNLAGSATTYDFTSLTGPRGTVTFAKIKGICVYVSTATDGYVLTLGNAASNQWYAPFSGSTVTEKVLAGGVWLRVAHSAQSTNPWTVDSSNKSFKLDPGVNTIAGTIIVWGV